MRNNIGIIKINGIIHLRINIADVLSIVTYFDEMTNPIDCMFIELSFKSTTTKVLLNYNTVYKWKKVIKAINKLLK